MNYSLLNADRTTQLKIVMVALIAVVVVIAVGINARVAGTDAQAKINDTVIKAGGPVMYTTRETLAIH